MSKFIISAAREHWCLNDAAITLAAARENQVYRVDTPSGSIALRVHRPGYRNLEEIRSELQWMSMLSENGLPVPQPIPAHDGSHYKRFNGTVVSVLSWLDGSPLSQISLTTDMYFQLGQTLSKMHTLADSWTLPTGFNRPTWNLIGEQPTWDRFWENPTLRVGQAKRLTEFRDHAQEMLSSMESLDVGLIHADLIPDNVLLHNEILQLIDFDDGGFGYRLFDLATITRRSRVIKPDNSLAEAAINGYSEHRDINETDLLLFEALRACTYVGWNISRFEEPSGPERNARYITEAELAINNYERLG